MTKPAALKNVLKFATMLFSTFSLSACFETGSSGGFSTNSIDDSSNNESSIPLLKSCGTTMNGAYESRQMYLTFTVPNGQVCQSESQQRLCTDGVFGPYSGSFAYTTCTPLPADPPVNSAFVIGDRILISKNTNVRAVGALNGQLLGTQTSGAIGTIVAGPTAKDVNNIIWWQVNYDDGVDGWSGEDNFTKLPAGSCGSSPNGSTISRTRYLASTVSSEQTCQSQIQTTTCLNGVWGPYTGTFTFESCSITGATSLLKSPTTAALNAAIAAPLISFRRTFSGGAYTNGAWFGGASIVLAVASYAGNTSADSRLLQQIRHTLTSGNEICANGGYPSQHERHVTGMFAIAKHTPRIWDQLSATEKNKIDLIMKAALIATAFTTNNNNPYILAGTQQYSLDGDSNLNRGWNPNYREGMIGGVLVSMVYFGGPAATKNILDTYNHAQFILELNANGMPNTYEIFNWKAANPSSNAPTGTMIQNGVKNYIYFASPLTDYKGIYTSLVNDTYGKNVTAGLNNGVGINGAGKIATGAQSLPNLGALGMLKEFDSNDANGPRSSVEYAYDGFRPHLTNQLVLIIGGYLPKGSAESNSAAARIKVGNTDLWYKMEKGYISYAKGSGASGPEGPAFLTRMGFPYVRSLWEDVLLPYHFP